MEYTCENCGYLKPVPVNLQGRSARCPECGTLNTIGQLEIKNKSQSFYECTCSFRTSVDVKFKGKSAGCPLCGAINIAGVATSKDLEHSLTHELMLQGKAPNSLNPNGYKSSLSLPAQIKIDFLALASSMYNFLKVKINYILAILITLCAYLLPLSIAVTAPVFYYSRRRTMTKEFTIASIAIIVIVSLYSLYSIDI